MNAPSVWGGTRRAPRARAVGLATPSRTKDSERHDGVDALDHLTDLTAEFLPVTSAKRSLHQTRLPSVRDGEGGLSDNR